MTPQKKQQALALLYRWYLILCRTPLSPNFLIFYPLYGRLIGLLKRASHGVMLDVGSGFSPFYRVANSRASLYVSLDYPASYELSAFDADPTSGQRHIWGDAHAIPVHSNSCDVVICTSVLEHVQEPWVVLAEIFRVLRPGGQVIGSVPFGLNLHLEPFDYFRISEHGLKSLGERLQFSVKQIIPLGKGFHAIGACVADALIRNVAGIRSNTVGSMGILELGARTIVLAVFYPLILVINVVSPVIDRLLPGVSLPMHYLFIYEKRVAGAA